MATGFKAFAYHLLPGCEMLNPVDKQRALLLDLTNNLRKVRTISNLKTFCSSFFIQFNKT